MKKWTKVGRRLAALGLTACMTAALAGCGSASQYTMTEDAGYMDAVAESPAAVESNSRSAGMGGASYNSYDYETEAVAEEAYDALAADVVDESASGEVSGRKLIRTVNLSVETKEFDLAVATVQSQVDAMGGYIENMETYNGSSYSGYRSNRNASMTVRIPEDQLSGFLEKVSEICNVVNRSENVEDVTLAYVDVESHRNALRVEQERLLELLEQAETIEDIITIEDRLSSVRYQLESMESQLRTYDNRIDYSTVYLYIDEVQELTPVEEETVWEQISGGFVDSLKSIGNGLLDIGIWLVVHIPYIVIWAGIIALIIVIVRTSYRRSIRKKYSGQNVQAQNSQTQNIQTQNSQAQNSQAQNVRPQAGSEEKHE